MLRLSIRLVKIALITAIYAAVTTLLMPISYGLIQVRVSDVLMPLPYVRFFGIEAVIGLTLGTLIANLISPFGIPDVILGSLANLISGLGSYFIGRYLGGRVIGRALACLIPVAVISFIIGYVLLGIIYNEFIGVEPLVAMGFVAIGETISAGIGGFLLITYLEKALGTRR
ncbi:MAG: transporter [Thermoprotei archaeon]|nr:MAG: transporter [Thermoprotei archaeon]